VQKLGIFGIFRVQQLQHQRTTRDNARASWQKISANERDQICISLKAVNGKKTKSKVNSPPNKILQNTRFAGTLTANHGDLWQIYLNRRSK
jgi:hypothetical protein